MKPGYLFGTLGALAALMGAGIVWRKQRKPVHGPILLIGDSLGVGLAGPLQALGLPVHSIAESGTTIEYWTMAGKAKLQAALASKPASVFVSLGTNDAFLGDQYAATAAAATWVLIELLAKGDGQIFWIGPPKLPSSYGSRASSAAVIYAIRVAVAQNPAVTWLDTTSLQIPRTDDQLHPTTEGYSRWAAALVDQLGVTFVSPSPAVEGSPAALGADDSDEEPSPRPPPPSLVTVPSGWTHRREATAPMRAFAVSVLAQRRPIGDVQTSAFDGIRVGALTEWHWDNHVGHEWKWHRGISLLMPAN